MTVRAVEWKKPYTWWKAITVDENKVISLNLRDENNLIIYDQGDNEIYVDLQLPAWIRPNYAFPVWITTGRVLVADDWDVTWTIIVAKTTSWDVIKLLYGDDWTLWMDNGTGLFKQIYFKADVDLIVQTIYNYINENLNTKTFFISGTTEEKKTKLGQAIQYYLSWKNPILSLGNTTYTLRDVVVWDFEQWTNDVYTFSSTIKSENGKFWEIVVNVPVTAQGHGSTVSSFTDTKYSAWAVVSATAPSNPSQWDMWYDTTTDTLNTYDGTQWNWAGWGWDVLVSDQPNNTLQSWLKLRAGTETDYGNLSNYDVNSIYYVY